MSSSPATVYAAEISHPNLRGRLTLLSALCTALGMLFIYFVGYLLPVRWLWTLKRIHLILQSRRAPCCLFLFKLKHFYFSQIIDFPSRTKNALAGENKNHIRRSIENSLMWKHFCTSMIFTWIFQVELGENLWMMCLKIFLMEKAFKEFLDLLLSFKAILIVLVVAALTHMNVNC